MQGDDRGDSPAYVMPPGTTMRYAMPAPDLLTGITGYNLYRVESAEEQVDWFLPAAAMLCIGVRAGPLAAQIGRRGFAPLAPAFLIGPSSSALRMTTHGGTMVGIGISAAGWAQLGLPPANAVHNQIVPASSLFGVDVMARFQDALDSMTADEALKPVLDHLLQPLLTHSDVNLPLVAALTRLSVTDGVIKAGDVADQLEILPSGLARLSQRYFGLTPKLLLRRSRFLRSFMQMFVADAAGRVGTIDSSYHDMSHYLRDANTFLGTTPRRFMQMATPLLKASIHMRAAVLGAPTQALHDDMKLAEKK